jgi:ABC-2 type transport system ATP-binding protein
VSGDDLAVRTEDLSKRFGETVAVDGVSLEIPVGDVFGLIGPDGAGKTTFMRLISGVMRADSGQAVVAGEDVIADPEAVKQRMGYLSQAFSLYADLSIEENIDFCGDLYLMPRDEVQRMKEEMLELTDLLRFRKRLVGRLSGGMKQKVGLICALINRPQVLILDEPTTGVDPISRRDFWRIISQLPEQGVTVVLCSPYMDEAARCRHLAMISRGRILAEGTPEEMRGMVDGTVLEVTADDVRAAGKALGDLASVRRVTPFGDALHVQVEEGREAVAEVRRALAEAGVDEDEIHEMVPSLEDAFMDIVTRGDRVA